jgi:hypothetical protein
MGTQVTQQKIQNKIVSRTFWATIIILVLTALTLLIVLADFVGYHPIRVGNKHHTDGNRNLTDTHQHNTQFHDTSSDTTATVEAAHE